MRRLALITVAVVLALGAAAALAAEQGADTFQVGNLNVTVEGGITPTRLPRKTKAPVTLRVGGSIETLDGSHPAAVRTIKLEFDKAGEMNTEGLPTCSVARLQSTLTAQAKKICRDALVGTGSATAEIALREQKPFSASGPLLIFNGKPKDGKQVLIFHVYAHVPAPTTFVTTAVISKTPGRFGTTAIVKVPTIVGGLGSLTAAKVRIDKTWTYKGKEEHLLLASCPSGSLHARGEFTFADGTRGSGEVVRACTPIG